ncbi:hypothetical protein QR680_003880 [Steinernema hermaphroditum]|uniref:Uncharacterized protein n=1 Tax=Steinernema hermaphroditum TaxID=289476 RepID=A0AA39LT38_9BILA|nr:hypothetical protein QR680_003880 [Steinernema hermaphroditum]
MRAFGSLHKRKMSAQGTLIKEEPVGVVKLEAIDMEFEENARGSPLLGEGSQFVGNTLQTQDDLPTQRLIDTQVADANVSIGLSSPVDSNNRMTESTLVKEEPVEMEVGRPDPPCPPQETQLVSAAVHMTVNRVKEEPVDAESEERRTPSSSNERREDTEEVRNYVENDTLAESILVKLEAVDMELEDHSQRSSFLNEENLFLDNLLQMEDSFLTQQLMNTQVADANISIGLSSPTHSNNRMTESTLVKDEPVETEAEEVAGLSEEYHGAIEDSGSTTEQVLDLVKDEPVEMELGQPDDPLPSEELTQQIDKQLTVGFSPSLSPTNQERTNGLHEVEFDERRDDASTFQCQDDHPTQQLMNIQVTEVLHVSTSTDSLAGPSRSPMNISLADVPTPLRSLTMGQAAMYRNFIVIGEQEGQQPPDVSYALVRYANKNRTYKVSGIRALGYYIIGINLRARIYSDERHGSSYEYDTTDIGDLSTVIAHEVQRFIDDKPYQQELKEFIEAFLDGLPGAARLNRNVIEDLVVARINKFREVFFIRKGERESYSFVSERSQRKRKWPPSSNH